jgi:hypothetical protein
MRTQIEHYSWEDSELDERQKEAIRNFQRRYAEQRPGFRISGWALAMFFAEVVAVSFISWALITLAFSLIEKNLGF